MAELLTSVETVEKTQRWTIKGFSALPRAVGEPTKSEQFEAGGRQWRLQVYPGGEMEESKEFVSLFLELVDAETNPLRAKFELAIINHAGHRANGIASAGYREFGPANAVLTVSPRWGKRNLILRATLLDESKGFMLNDAVTFEVKLTVPGATQHRSSVNAMCSKFEQNTLKSFNALLEADLHSDVTLICEGEEILAHKAILAARSPVFKAMFAHKMSESLEGSATIDEMPLTVFRELLRHFNLPLC